MNTRRRMLFALVTLAVPACSADSAVPTTAKVLTYDQALKEYRDATARLELAPGATWRATAKGLDPADESGAPQMFEAGVGSQGAELQWYCSWAGQALTSTGADQQQALDTLDGFEELGVWQKMDANGHALFTTILAGARLGDLASLTDYVDGNCA